MSRVAPARSVHCGSAAPRPQDPRRGGGGPSGPAGRAGAVAREGRGTASRSAGGQVCSSVQGRCSRHRCGGGASGGSSAAPGTAAQTGTAAGTWPVGRPDRSGAWACAASVLPWTRAQGSPLLRRDVFGVDHRRRVQPITTRSDATKRRFGRHVHPRAAVLTRACSGLGWACGRPPPTAAHRPRRPTTRPGAVRQAPAVGLAAQVSLALFGQGGGDARVLHGDPSFRAGSPATDGGGKAPGHTSGPGPRSRCGGTLFPRRSRL
jgi:hypothetical protein